MEKNRKRKIRLVVTADGRENAGWVAEGVVEAITTVVGDAPAVGGRDKPLVALPLVGTGEGGFKDRRGRLIHALLPALRDVARKIDIDIALVLLDDRDHAAVQAERSSDDWSDVDAKHLEQADKLGAQAARNELSLFLGSGVSIPLGLPNWESLLTQISGKKIPFYSTKNAPAIAQLIKDFGHKRLKAKIAESMTAVKGCAPAHLLLAGLSVRQTVTTNYDTAYETASDGSYGVGRYRVLTRQLAAQPDPWILKIHGDVNSTKSIVITTNDYKRLENKHGSLHALVESLLLTSHLLFVGYSMGDHDFDVIAKRVRKVRALADSGKNEKFATVLALHPAAVKKQKGFKTIPMLRDDRPKEAARQLEIFLDRVSWTAARESRRSHEYVLDPSYQDLVSHDRASDRLRDLLSELVKLRDDEATRRSRAWPLVESMLTDLGAWPRQPNLR